MRRKKSNQSKSSSPSLYATLDSLRHSSLEWTYASQIDNTEFNGGCNPQMIRRWVYWTYNIVANMAAA